MVPLIDRATGAVRLQDDLVLTAGLSPERLTQYIHPRAGGKTGKSQWYDPFSVQTVYGVLDVSLYFRKGSLSLVKARIRSEYGPQQAMIKGRHDGFLTELLGRPNQERPLIRTIPDRIFFKALGQDWPKQAKELTWTYRWGSVTSTVEAKEGLAEFRVEWEK